MKKLRIFIIAFFTTLTFSTQSQESVQLFTEPKPIVLDGPYYPAEAGSEGAEGWVLLNFMIDTNGKAFEPTVLGSSGPNIFHLAAKQALSRSQWEPAKIDGVPIEGGFSTLFRFTFEDSEKAARPVFVRQYKNLAELVDSGNKTKAESLLNSMNKRGSLNNYEGALLALANYMYLGSFEENEEAQVTYLNKALAYDWFSANYVEGRGYLPDDLLNTARLDLLILLVKTKQYAEALIIYERLKELGFDVEAFTPAITQIQNLKSNNSAYTLQGKTGLDGLWHITLMKRGLFIDNLGNSITEFRLRCDRKFQHFPFQEDSEYQIPESWGDCNLEVSGAAETNFEVTQF